MTVVRFAWERVARLFDRSRDLVTDDVLHAVLSDDLPLAPEVQQRAEAAYEDVVKRIRAAGCT